MTISEKTIELFISNTPGAPLVVLNGEGDEGERVWEAARDVAEADFSLAVIGALNWERELTPWEAPALFKGSAPFSGRADDYLRALTGAILPGIVAALPEKPTWMALAGYSLAGLFALYAPYKTDAFARVASISGSLWYPGWVEFAETGAWKRRPDCVYLSLGDREGRARNPVMRPVEENTRRTAWLYGEQDVPVRFELNPGGHFNEPDARVARALAWLVSHKGP